MASAASFSGPGGSGARQNGQLCFNPNLRSSAAHSTCSKCLHPRVKEISFVMASRQIQHLSSVLPVLDLVASQEPTESLCRCCGARSALAKQHCLWLAFQWARWHSLLQYTTRLHRAHAESLVSTVPHLAHAGPALYFLSAVP